MIRELYLQHQHSRINSSKVLNLNCIKTYPGIKVIVHKALDKVTLDKKSIKYI